MAFSGIAIYSRGFQTVMSASAGGHMKVEGGMEGETWGMSGSNVIDSPDTCMLVSWKQCEVMYCSFTHWFCPNTSNSRGISGCDTQCMEAIIVKTPSARLLWLVSKIALILLVITQSNHTQTWYTYHSVWLLLSKDFMSNMSINEWMSINLLRNNSLIEIARELVYVDLRI